MISRNAPPQNLEAERWLLGGILLDNDVLHDVAQFLTVDDFYRDAHQVIYRAVIDLYSQGKAIDAVTMADELTRRDQYKQIGGDELLLEITNSVPHAANAKYHAEIIHQKSITRQLIQGATEIIQEGYSNLHTAQELVEKAEQRIFAIGDRGETGGVLSSSEAVAATMQTILAREQGKRDGVLTGFNDLDYLLDGLKPQQLCYLGARPSQGKTAFTLSITERVAIRQEKPVLYFSLEMGTQSLVERLICSIGNIGGDSLKRPWTMGCDQRERVSLASQAIGSAPIDFDDRPGLTVSKIAASARRVATRRPLCLIVIDYLGLIEIVATKTRTRQEDVAEVSKRLKDLARELNVPILCAHQLNRAVESRDDHRPRMSDLRESGALEQDADVVLLLHRPEYYDPNDQPGIAEVIVAKNRSGPIGTIELMFTRECTRFDSVARDTPPNQSY